MKILADNAKKAIRGNVAIQVTQPGRKFFYASGAIWWPTMQLMQVAKSGVQYFNSCKWRHLVANFETNASGAILWPFLQLIQVAPSAICHLVAKLER